MGHVSRMAPRVALALFLLLTALDLSKAQDCGTTSRKTCEEEWPGTVEIYSERHFNGKVVRRCCDKGSTGETAEKQKAHTGFCTPTHCIKASDAGTNPNLCSQRMVDGKEIELEEALRDHCDTKDDQPGLSALCCQANSTEGYLLSLLGAEMNEFPHQAGLSEGCGGTIYNKRFIITAAHCIVDKDNYTLKAASEMTVVLGTNIAGYNYDSKGHSYKVLRAISHEKYSKLKGSPQFDKDNTFNDIALLELNRDIQFGPKVKALEIAPKGFQPMKYADSAVIAGWGTTDALDLSPHLQKANLLFRNDKDCFAFNDNADAWGPHAEMEGKENQLLCVGGILNGLWSPTAGGGDSGGPAICRGADGYAVLCGVTSFGGSDEKCSKYDNSSSCLPSVYAEVEHFRDWIVKHAGKQDPSTFFRYKLYGDEVPDGKYDHQVHITSSTGKSCGGTLISKNTVVTAAQCLIKNDQTLATHDNIKVVTSKKDLSSPGTSFGVKGISILKGYEKTGKPKLTDGNKFKRSLAGYRDPSSQAAHGYTRIMATDAYYKHNLAVLKLDKDVDIDESKLAKLPSSDDEPTGHAIEISFPRNTTFGSRLMQREFKLVPSTNCQARMNRLSAIGAKAKVDEDQICAVETYSGGSRCWRELGGGLICPGENGGQDVLCGVQVFRLCEFSIPNGFINIAKHRRWIEKASNAL